MPHPKVKLSDDTGNEVSVTSNRLDVNAYLSATPTIDIGDVSLLLGGTAASTNAGSNTDQTLRVTMAVDDTLTQTLLGLSHANEDDGHTSADKGIMALGVRNDTLAALAGTDGDYAPLQVDGDGGLYVSDKYLKPGTGLLQSMGSSFGGNYGILSMGVRNDTLAHNLLGGSVADGDITTVQINSIGGLYVTGSEVENAAVQSEPLLIGGRYDSSARTLGSGDAGAVALNASGHVLMDVVDGGQLDTIIDTLETTLTAIETDQAAIEALLITIDSDTDAIKTAVQLIDNAIDGSEMQVDIVSSAALTVDLGSNNDVTVTSGSVGHDITGLASDDNDTVGTSAEKISGADGDVACKRVDIMAHPSNTGYIWVGDSAVSVDGLNGGIRLSPGDFYSMDIDNTGDVYAIATVDGENVCFNYFT